MPFLPGGLKVVLQFSSERIVTLSCLWLLQVWAAPCECGQKVKAVCQSRFRYLISKIIAAIQHWAFHTEAVIACLVLGSFAVCSRRFSQSHISPVLPSVSKCRRGSATAWLCAHTFIVEKTLSKNQHLNHLVGVSGWNNHRVLWRQQLHPPLVLVKPEVTKVAAGKWQDGLVAGTGVCSFHPRGLSQPWWLQDKKDDLFPMFFSVIATYWASGLPAAGSCPMAPSFSPLLEAKSVKGRAIPSHGSRWLELSHQEPMTKSALVVSRVGMEAGMSLPVLTFQSCCTRWELNKGFVQEFFTQLESPNQCIMCSIEG